MALATGSSTTASKPLMVTSEETQLNTILHAEGAIALIDLRDLKSGLKIVTVDNLPPGAKDYPLHE